MAEVSGSTFPPGVWAIPSAHGFNAAWEAPLPSQVNPARGGNFSLVAEKAEPTSILARVGAFTASLGKGLARILGGAIATVGTAASVIPQAAIILSDVAGKFVGTVAGGVAGFLVAVVTGDLRDILRGAADGGRMGGLFFGGVAAIALSIPYLLTISITNIGTGLMAAGKASHGTIEGFHGISDHLYREIRDAFRPPLPDY